MPGVYSNGRDGTIWGLLFPFPLSVASFRDGNATVVVGAADMVGTGVDISGGHTAVFRTPRTRFVRIVGLELLELDELESESF